MGWLKGLLQQLRVLLRKDAVERELDEEMAFHIEARWVRWLEDLVADVRYGCRGLAKTPLFTLVAVVTIALGIGANSGLFGLIDGLLFRGPTGVQDREGLVWIDNAGNIERISYPDYRDLREAIGQSIEMATHVTSRVGIGADGAAARVTAHLVSANYFDVLRVRPMLGRGFLPEEDGAGAEPVVVLSYSVWQQLFAEDPDILGSTVSVNGHPYVVVGIAPPRFVGVDFSEPAALWVPVATQPTSMPRGYDPLSDRSTASFHVIGRLAGGLEPEAAASALASAAAAVEGEYPERFRPLRLEVVPVRGWVRADKVAYLSTIAAIAWATTALILLIACANVAGLMLARSVRRRREMAIRMAIGAGRGRLTRLLLTEAAVLASGGALLGVLVASWAASLLQARVFANVAPLEVTPDGRTFAFALLLAASCVAIFGLLPAAGVARARPVLLLLGSGGGGTPRSRLQNALVVGQLALGVVLLFSSALFLRRLQAAQEVAVGFDAESVLAVTLDLGAAGYRGSEAQVFHRSLVEAVEALPGVVVASAPSFAPFTPGAALMSVSLPGRPATGTIGVVAVGVAERYFETMGISLLEGRSIVEEDLEASTTVAVVSASFARRAWPGQSAVGRRFTLGRGGSDVQVIGVAGEIVTGNLHGEQQPQVYLPFTKHYRLLETNLLIRAERDPESLMALVRARIAALNPAVPIVEMSTLQARIERTLVRSREIVRIVLGFGALALLLAGLGLYGVVAFTVAGRTREIGIRMALGAGAEKVTAEVLSRGARLSLAGLCIGAVFAAFFGIVLAGAVEGIQPVDFWAGAMVASVLFGVVLLASWIPARRAARVDPTGPLRQE